MNKFWRVVHWSKTLPIILSYLSVCCCQKVMTPLENVVAAAGEEINMFTVFRKSAPDENVEFYIYNNESGTKSLFWSDRKPSIISTHNPFLRWVSELSLGSNLFRYDLHLTLPLNNLKQLKMAATQYEASINQAVKTVARVMALERVSCSSSVGHMTVTKDTPVTLTCNTTCYSDMIDSGKGASDIYWMPALSWMGDSNATYGRQLPTLHYNYVSGIGTVVSSFLIFAAGNNHERNFTCKLRIVARQGKGPQKAMMESLTLVPPQYTDECKTSFLVEHLTTDIAFIPPKPSNGVALHVLSGDRLRCSANGYPIPTYKWYCDQGLKQFQGATLEITSDFQNDLEYVCQCHATNTVNNSVGTAVDELKFKASGLKGLNLQSPAAKSSEFSSEWIVIAMALVPVLLVVLLFVGVVCWKRKNFPTLDDSDTTVYQTEDTWPPSSTTHTMPTTIMSDVMEEGEEEIESEHSYYYLSSDENLKPEVMFSNASSLPEELLTGYSGKK